MPTDGKCMYACGPLAADTMGVLRIMQHHAVICMGYMMQYAGRDRVFVGLRWCHAAT